MNLSADMREVWKRLAASGWLLYGEREDEYRFAQHGQIIGDMFVTVGDLSASAMQGCRE